jgi:hypothetical protein
MSNKTKKYIINPNLRQEVLDNLESMDKDGYTKSKLRGYVLDPLPMGKKRWSKWFTLDEMDTYLTEFSDENELGI